MILPPHQTCAVEKVLGPIEFLNSNCLVDSAIDPEGLQFFANLPL
jgi:hypothetical protein